MGVETGPGHEGRRGDFVVALTKVIDDMDLRFMSAGAVPVARASIQAHEWELVKAALAPSRVTAEDMVRAFQIAFDEWRKRARAASQGDAPHTDGEYFVRLLNELAAGKPWAEMGRAPRRPGT